MLKPDFWWPLVSILTRPEGRVQSAFPAARGRRKVVSILTRPEGRVQCGEISHIQSPVCVSILTRPEGRVQSPVGRVSELE